MAARHFSTWKILGLWPVSKNPESELTEINVEPYWNPLRTDPRFQDVVRRVSLSPD